jgi:glycosyltransferase involved in cell wall biosynthesis
LILREELMSAANSVTVGMPVHNDPSGLLRSVPTVLNQTWKGHIRLLIVDDGSTDETAEVIASLQQVHDDIEVVRNDRNMGRPFARNQVLDHADSEYLAWLDAGDLWHPRKLEIQFDTLTRHETDPDHPVLCTTAFRWVFADSSQERIRVPDTSGDQLYNALTSTLPPYLWTLLGTTAAFRSAGRFDERLSRRQDYEFFVRFIERGGRVVATPPEPPLATYMKSDVGRSPQDVGSSNRVIRQIHEPLYARYGRRFASQMRRRQLALTARFYDHNGKRATAIAYRLLGWVWAPSLPSLGKVRSMLQSWGRRALTWGARVLVRAAKPAFPLLRRLGVTSRLRRMATPHGMMPAYYRELQRFSPAASEVAEKIEASIADGGSTDVLTWLRLEQAYRQSGRLDSAQLALERGRERFPESAELRMRVVELLALRGRWLECVDAWNSLSPHHMPAATQTTYNRLAWAHRELGNAEESVRVAETGLARWPGDPWLLGQLYKARAQTTDWSNALEPGATPAKDGLAHGMVTKLGFLVGERGPVQGWASTSSEGSKVHLMVNGAAVTSTGAAGCAGDRPSFSFNCTELLEYLGDGDVISFEAGGRTLPIDRYGSSVVVRPGYPSRVDELWDKLSKGFVFENLGKLVEGNNPRSKKATLALYDEVRELIMDEEGYQLYPIYGNLLGAIRENDFISHDVGGFDTIYISSHKEATAVREEFASICRRLVDSDYTLKLKPWSAYVRPSRGSDSFIDLNYGWFTDQGELHISYGWRHQPVTDPVRLAFPREAPVGSHWVPVPGNAEEVLNQIYGPTWVTPDQGYVPEVEMRRDEDFLLTPAELEAIRLYDQDLVEIAPESPVEG